MSRPPSAGSKPQKVVKPKTKINSMIALTGGTDDRKVELTKQNISMPVPDYDYLKSMGLTL